jgi:hypothetical protein
MNLSRRNFLTKTAVGTAAMISIPAIVSNAMPVESEKSKKKYSLFENENVVLFQGDSITDASREKERELPNNPRSFGQGYAFLAASALLNALCPKKILPFITAASAGTKCISWPNAGKKIASI